ncbi:MULTISPECIES: DUF2834 domain-containing protein [Catenuloplanes]|uniref:DUF2834 domain-containing protein n=1 Tax=Catenuloplanes niger TaxID=587534 RepID=A0AAE3ZW21_9ACTN|nr:DUF2834 domain-containing protein [Catenuloplanes niger]MDR7326932.1 hypothetical protein [Catenuloplanes niger]
MLPRRVYWGLAALGTIVPYTALGIFISRHGPDPVELTREAFGSPGAVFFALDVILCAVTVLVSVLRDTRDRRIRTVVTAATVLVGPSCGLPLWLALRQPANRTEHRT